MDLDCIKKVNLVEQLAECYPHIEDPSEEEIHAWDEDQIRAYYTEAREPQNRNRSAYADDQVRSGFVQLMPDHYQHLAVSKSSHLPGITTASIFQVR